MVKKGEKGLEEKGLELIGSYGSTWASCVEKVEEEEKL
jgi:hypothetical protein